MFKWFKRKTEEKEGTFDSTTLRRDEPKSKKSGLSLFLTVGLVLILVAVSIGIVPKLQLVKQYSKSVLTIGYVGEVDAQGGALDYYFTGANDNTRVNSAIAALPASGGEVMILSPAIGQSTINFSGTVSVPANVAIVGAGQGTSIVYNASSPCFTATGNGTSFQNLKVDAGSISMGATTGWLETNVQIGSILYTERSPNSSIVDNTYTGNVIGNINGISIITVTVNGPTDGGNYGPNTVGTTTSGLQEAINYALTLSVPTTIQIGSGWSSPTAAVTVTQAVGTQIAGITIRSDFNTLLLYTATNPTYPRGPVIGSITLTNNNTTTGMYGIKLEGLNILQLTFNMAQWSISNTEVHLCSINNVLWQGGYQAMGTHFSACNFMSNTTAAGVLTEPLTVNSTQLAGSGIASIGQIFFDDCALLATSLNGAITTVNLLNITGVSGAQMYFSNCYGYFPSGNSATLGHLINIVNMGAATGFNNAAFLTFKWIGGSIEGNFPVTMVNVPSSQTQLWGGTQVDINTDWQLNATSGGGSKLLNLAFTGVPTGGPIGNHYRFVGTSALSLSNAGTPRLSLGTWPSTANLVNYLFSLSVDITDIKNEGFNVTTPAFPAAWAEVMNTNLRPVMVIITSVGSSTLVGGCITDVTQQQSNYDWAHLQTVTLGQTFILLPGEQIQFISYSGTPTWAWRALN